MERIEHQKSIAGHVGAAIRTARRKFGMTLAELSKKSGISTAMISKIERGTSSASLSSLETLANAFGIPVINFFGATAEYTDIYFTKSGTGVTVSRLGNTYQHDCRLLGQLARDGLAIESQLITLTDPQEEVPLFHQPGNIEFVHMLSGAMKFHCGSQIFELYPGDSLTFEGSAPHSPVELVTTPVVYLNIIAKQV